MQDQVLVWRLSFLEGVKPRGDRLRSFLASLGSEPDTVGIDRCRQGHCRLSLLTICEQIGVDMLLTTTLQLEVGSKSRGELNGSRALSFDLKP